MCLFFIYFIIQHFIPWFEFKIDFKEFMLILLPTIGYFIVGFVDDVKKHIKKENEGLSVNKKFLFQLIISAAYFAIYLSLGKTTTLNIFSLNIDLKFMYGLFIILLFLGTTNAVNITDGIDGLSSGVTVIVCFFIMILAIFISDKTVVVCCVAMIFSLLSFLIYNSPPAKIFMGDTGSLMLGGFIASLVLMLEIPILLIILGIPYIIETLSVIIQVGYYKITKGKRIFKMAPIHHHLELSGFKEGTIDLIFYIVAILSGILTIFIYLNWM